MNESPSFYIQCTATLPHELNEQSSLEFVRLCECECVMTVMTLSEYSTVSQLIHR